MHELAKLKKLQIGNWKPVTECRYCWTCRRLLYSSACFYNNRKCL